MRIFVTGGTGVLGCATLPLLVAAGHQVRALVGERGAPCDAGGEPIRADLFAADSLHPAVAGCDAILHLSTHIPPTRNARRRTAWAENDRIRATGTRVLAEVAAAQGVRTFVYPSAVFVYPDSGDRWIDAHTIAPAPAAIARSTLDAEEAVKRFTAAGGCGIVLRLGGLYGPETPTMEEMLSYARRGIAPVFGRADGYQSSLWVADAATALVAALIDTPAGVFDVVDDRPMRRTDLATAFARAVGRKRLWMPPAVLTRLTGGVFAEVVSRSLRVSNRQYKEMAGWTPRVPDFAAGLVLVAEEEGSARQLGASRAAQ